MNSHLLILKIVGHNQINALVPLSLLNKAFEFVTFCKFFLKGPFPTPAFL